MHDLVKTASRALSAHDADRLEELAAEARVRSANPVALNYAELSKVTPVLAAQVRAAQTHLRLYARLHDRGRGAPWDR